MPKQEVDIDEWRNESIDLVAADGSILRCKMGGPIPPGMPRSSPVVLLPELFVASVNEPIFIQTRLESLLETMREFDEGGPIEALAIAVSARRSVDEKIVRNDEILSRMHAGCEAAEREWNNFSDDCAILAAFTVFRGGSVAVVPSCMDDAHVAHARILKPREPGGKCVGVYRTLSIDRSTLEGTNP
jgi:hypothetical protein